MTRRTSTLLCLGFQNVYADFFGLKNKHFAVLIFRMFDMKNKHFAVFGFSECV